MNNPTSIALLVCHFGTYPWYLPYFIHSCKFNPTIDFYIITDNVAAIPNKTDNIKVVYQTLDTFKKNASEKLGFTISNFINNNKVADFKPAFSFLFPEITASYTFWGYTELDIIFGNIRDFITDEVLENHDVVSGRHDIVYGKFSLFKNSPKTQTLFMESRDYKPIFLRPQKFYFDSCNVLLEEDEITILDFPDCVQSITFVVMKAESYGKLKIFFDFLGLAGLTIIDNGIYWNNGILNYKNEFEFMYYDPSQYYDLSKSKKVEGSIPDKFGFGLTQS
jgi:hypothetical protein